MLIFCLDKKPILVNFYNKKMSNDQVKCVSYIFWFLQHQNISGIKMCAFEYIVRHFVVVLIAT